MTRPSYVTWPRIDRSRGQRQDKYLYHFGIFFVIFRNILSEYHIQIKTIKICKLRQGQTMIIIEPLFRTEFLKNDFFIIFLKFSLNFHNKKSIDWNLVWKWLVFFRFSTKINDYLKFWMKMTNFLNFSHEFSTWKFWNFARKCLNFWIFLRFFFAKSLNIWILRNWPIFLKKSLFETRKLVLGGLWEKFSGKSRNSWFCFRLFCLKNK